ncbi:MAG: sigma-54-dependent transcriptional regulator [Nitrospiria bacterium]
MRVCAAEKSINPILIVDDEPSMRVALCATLQSEGYPVLTASSGDEALEICTNRSEASPFSAILTDIKMPGLSGLDLFRHVRRKWKHIPVILMSAFGTVEGAVEAMKSGVSDYLVKPFAEETLITTLKKTLHHKKTEPAIDRSGQKQIVTQDNGMKKILKMAEVVAASQATVLIQAESGTGKELLARFIHDRSPRAHRPFVAINCAAVPEALLESELFGYEKGAFTGASAKKAGRFELAHLGTLLLDEVSEMHVSLQAKLLRVLQEREVDILGSKNTLPINIRVIATTNRPLLDEVKAGRFREDLYYRLNVFPLRIPPLRDRIGDVPMLASHFIQLGAIKNGKPATTITPEALSALQSMPWPGNVREFENIIERALLLAEDGLITPDHLLFPETRPETTEQARTPITTVWEAERSLILDTLTQVSGNRTHAARMLGISIRTLRNKLREYHRLDPDCEANGSNRL